MSKDKSCFFCKWNGVDAECSEKDRTCKNFEPKNKRAFGLNITTNKWEEMPMVKR